MNYSELINNIRDLGFSEDDEIEEMGELIPNSINRAISEINIGVAPILEKHEVELTDDDEGYIYIDMLEVDESFLDFADTPVLFERDGTSYYKKFADYDIEMGRTVVINADEYKGKFRIFYKVAHETFTLEDEMLEEELPLPLRAHHLVPLLASFYVWEEDDPSRATQYYNIYEQRAQEVVSSTKQLKAKIITDAYYGGI